MAAPLFTKGIPLLLCLRLQNHRHLPLGVGVFLSSPPRRQWWTAAESNKLDDNVNVPSSFSGDEKLAVLSAHEKPRWDNPDYRKWKTQEAEILEDIEPIVCLTKEILHSDRYMDGERLSAEDEKAVINKLLAYHPHSEDKIGCGVGSIMVDRHPQFRNSRCLFVIRTDGGWIDFSYQKCILAYIRDKYPSYAERFIREHYKRGSG
ncbi:hypothetical protein RJ641_029180 [Dillenia turbinata]|uniref:Protein DCL, chloroplastic n=1 Tax=Dillenia turbinata TaxID=194707 RepID=A0AAN8VXQ8_9MAGN